MYSRRSQRGAAGDSATDLAEVAPGKHTRSGRIQKKASGTSSTAAPDDAFDRATSGQASGLPYRDQLESSFGVYLGNVSAYLGGNAASEGLGNLGAEAAARGSSVAFRDASPDLGLVAHETAHVVQQGAAGGGVQRKATDPITSYDDAEARADAAAEAVVTGQPVPDVGSAPTNIHRRWAAGIGQGLDAVGDAVAAVPRTDEDAPSSDDVPEDEENPVPSEVPPSGYSDDEEEEEQEADAAQSEEEKQAEAAAQASDPSEAIAALAAMADSVIAEAAKLLEALTGGGGDSQATPTPASKPPATGHADAPPGQVKAGGLGWLDVDLAGLLGSVGDQKQSGGGSHATPTPTTATPSPSKPQTPAAPVSPNTAEGRRRFPAVYQKYQARLKPAEQQALQAFQSSWALPNPCPFANNPNLKPEEKALLAGAMLTATGTKGQDCGDWVQRVYQYSAGDAYIGKRQWGRMRIRGLREPEYRWKSIAWSRTTLKPHEVNKVQPGYWIMFVTGASGHSVMVNQVLSRDASTGRIRVEVMESGWFGKKNIAPRFSTWNLRCGARKRTRGYIFSIQKPERSSNYQKWVEKQRKKGASH